VPPATGRGAVAKGASGDGLVEMSTAQVGSTFCDWTLCLDFEVSDGPSDEDSACEAEVTI
jgi:hypothetical protein